MHWSEAVLESFNDRLLMSICRFFETEAIAVLTMIISKYKITIREEPGETFRERKERILKSRHGGLFLTWVYVSSWLLRLYTHAAKSKAC